MTEADGGDGFRVDFVAGMARSGTTWLGRALGSHPDVAVFGETSFFGRLYVPPRADGLYGDDELRRVRAIQREQDWCTTTGDESGCLRNTTPDEYASLVDRAFARLRLPTTVEETFSMLALTVAESEHKPRAVEKTPHHVHWLERIAERFPESRFVLLTRDPYGFMLSLEHLGDRLEGRGRRLLDQPWRHPVLCAFAWRGYMLSLERALDGYGDRILVVDSRDLRRRPGALLADIQSFLGLEVRDLAVEAAGENTSFVRGERPALGGVDVLWMNVIAGRVMRRNGYEQRRAPLQPLRLLASVLTLPVSVAYASAVLPRRVPGSFREYLSTWVGRPSRAV